MTSEHEKIPLDKIPDASPVSIQNRSKEIAAAKEVVEAHHKLGLLNLSWKTEELFEKLGNNFDFSKGDWNPRVGRQKIDELGDTLKTLRNYAEDALKPSAAVLNAYTDTFQKKAGDTSLDAAQRKKYQQLGDLREFEDQLYEERARDTNFEDIKHAALLFYKEKIEESKQVQVGHQMPEVYLQPMDRLVQELSSKIVDTVKIDSETNRMQDPLGDEYLRSIAEMSLKWYNTGKKTQAPRLSQLVTSVGGVNEPLARSANNAASEILKNALVKSVEDKPELRVFVKYDANRHPVSDLDGAQLENVTVRTNKILYDEIRHMMTNQAEAEEILARPKLRIRKQARGALAGIGVDPEESAGIPTDRLSPGRFSRGQKTAATLTGGLLLAGAGFLAGDSTGSSREKRHAESIGHALDETKTNLTNIQGRLGDTERQLGEKGRQLGETSNLLADTNRRLRETARQLDGANSRYNYNLNDLTEYRHQVRGHYNKIIERLWKEGENGTRIIRAAGEEKPRVDQFSLPKDQQQPHNRDNVLEEIHLLRDSVNRLTAQLEKEGDIGTRVLRDTERYKPRPFYVKQPTGNENAR